MAIRDCFAGLFPEMSKKGVSGVSGVATAGSGNQFNALAATPMRNTFNRTDVSGVSPLKNETPETHQETGHHQKGVAGNPIRNQCLIGTETPATPETRQKHDALRWQHMRDERAAIMEFSGGLPRHDADTLAFADTFLNFVTTCYPAIRAEFDAMVTNAP